MRRARGLPAGLAAVLVLCGCGPFAPRDLPLVADPADIVGTWERTDGGEPVVLEIRGDGTMTFTNVPRALGELGLGEDCDDLLADSAERVSGEGTWTPWAGDQYDIEFAGRGSLAFPGGLVDFSRLHFLCTDPDSSDVYTFDRE